MSRLDHVSISEFHGLGTLSPQFAGDDDFASLRAGFHDEAHDAVARTTDGKAGEELELERLGLRLGAQSAILDALGVQFHGAVGEFKSLLDDARQFADALAFLAQNVLGFGGANDHLGPVGGGADLDAGVAVLGEFAGEEFIEFGVEDTVGNELAFGGHFGAGGHHLFG